MDATDSAPAVARGRDLGGRAEPAQSSCPLCGSREHRLIHTIAYEDIRYVYRRILRVEIAAEPWRTLDYLRCAECDLRFFSPQVCGGPNFYEQLQTFPWYYLEDKVEYGVAGHLIPQGSSVLEIGCGAGAFSAFLPAGCRYHGLEFNGEAIRKAQQRGLDVCRGSIEEMAQTECQFDAVCAFQVLEHVASPASFLAAAERLLRPGGLLIVAVPSEDSFMADEVNNVLNMPPHHVTRWTDAALESIAAIVGMRLTHLEHEPVSDMHLRPLANASVWRAVREKLGIPVPMVSKRATALWARALLRLASLPIERRARRRGQRPFGHSTIAAYRKKEREESSRAGV